MKKISPLLSSLAVSAFAVIALPSCITYEETVVHGGGSNYRTVSSQSSFSAGLGSDARPMQYRDSRGFSPHEQSRSPFFYDSYDDHRGQNHYSHSSPRRDEHCPDDHKKDSKKDDNLKHHPNSYRIAGGSTGSKKKPTGYHSVSWYKSRGYDVNKLTLKNEKGQTYKKKRWYIFLRNNSIGSLNAPCCFVTGEWKSIRPRATSPAGA